MNKKKGYLYGLFFSLLLLLIFIDLNSPGINAPHVVKTSGVSSTLDEIKALINSINNFISGIVSFTKMVGFSTFIFFSFVLIFSSGLSAIGVPKGWISFLMSVAIVDFIWILWKETFSPVSLNYLKDIVKSNLIIMIPVFIFAVIKWGIPLLYRKIIRRIKLSMAKRKSGAARMETLRLSDEFLEASSGFQKHLNHDLISAGDGDPVVLSPETVGLSKKIREILSRLEE